MFYRAIMKSVDAKARTAYFFFTSILGMRTRPSPSATCARLICFDYAAQAHKCFLYRPDADSAPVQGERQKLVNVPCVIQVQYRSMELSFIRILDGGASKKKDFFGNLRKITCYKPRWLIAEKRKLLSFNTLVRFVTIIVGTAAIAVGSFDFASLFERDFANINDEEDVLVER